MKLNPNKIPVNQPCVICNGHESRALIDLDFEQFSYPGKFHLRQCVSCNLIFNSPRLLDQEFPKLYDANYYFFSQTAQQAIAHVKSQYLRSIALIEHTPVSRRIVEIGSAKGYYLALLKALGWTVQGVELSAFAASFAERMFDIPVFNGTVETYSDQCKERFDVVAAFDVIEHVLAPDKFVRAISQLLKTGGTLILDTPNGNAKHIQTHRELWSGFIPFHIYFFNQQNLQRLLEKYGFSVSTAFSYNNAFQSYQERKKMVEPSLKEKIYETLGIRGALSVLKNRVMLIGETKSRLNKLIAQAAADVQKMPKYMDTPDASLPLAATLEGENLVIIARKL
jgi:SAM-dependent methyltransferase